jgi:hypothetical protein
MLSQYDNIPEELRWDKQWCLAGPDATGKFKAPHSASSRGIFLTKPNLPFGWKDFEDILEDKHIHTDCGIGYILTATDPYTCIDLDVKNATNESDPSKWTTPEQLARFHKIIELFDSYTEYSNSGQGFHIWVRGKIGNGLKRDGVEIYSQERFIVCTGNVFLNHPIQPRQDLLTTLANEIRSKSKTVSMQLVDVEETETDAVIFERAASAGNADKFIELCEGVWLNNYPSQSEADLALMSIFTFYSKSNIQCRRMFRATKLGERPKATKNDVALNRILGIIRSRQALEEEQDAHGAEVSKNLLENVRLQQAAQAAHIVQLHAHQTAQQSAPAPAQHPLKQLKPPKPPKVTVAPGGVPYDAETYLPKDNIPTAQSIADSVIKFPDQANRIEGFYTSAIYDEAPDISGDLTFPPGTIGQIARYIYDYSPRPVSQVAIVAALGLAAGFCGRSFNISNTGLNLYIVLIAKSAVGKESMHSGLSYILKSIGVDCVAANKSIDFTDYVSGPALSKAIATNNCFLNVNGEWGRKLIRLANENSGDSAMASLRTVMTHLYQKSGANSIAGGMGYSTAVNNVGSTSGAAYSMIGEATPTAFMECLTESMMADGFMSRFTIIEYDGERVPLNQREFELLDRDMVNKLISIANHAETLSSSGIVQSVFATVTAQKMMDDFNLECDEHINGNANDESLRQMWNRAHLKVLKISALLAVMDNYIAPIISEDQVEWALKLIIMDISLMRARLNDGKIGTSDRSREKRIIYLMEKFMNASAIPAAYHVSKKMHEEGIVSKTFFTLQTNRSGPFTNNSRGHTFMLDSTLKSLIDQGYLAEVPKDKLFKEFGQSGRAFRILKIR